MMLTSVSGLESRGDYMMFKIVHEFWFFPRCNCPYHERDGGNGWFSCLKKNIQITICCLACDIESITERGFTFEKTDRCPCFLRLACFSIEQYYFIPGDDCCYWFDIGVKSLVDKCSVLLLTFNCIVGRHLTECLSIMSFEWNHRRSWFSSSNRLSMPSVNSDQCIHVCSK